MRDATFLLLDSLEAARRDCEARVEKFPEMYCEIFDAEGKARPPMLTILHPSAAAKDELSERSVGRRKIGAIVLIVAALPLFWWDHRANGTLVVPTYVGITLIILAFRLLYWNMARGERIREQERRVEEHLQREHETRGERAEGEKTQGGGD